MDNCTHCEGKGYVYVPNGLDDVDTDTCCCMWEHEEESQ